MSGGMRQRVVVRGRRGYLNMEGDAPHRVQERRRMANSRGILHDDRHLIDVRHDGGIGPSKRGSLRLRSSAEAWAGGDDPPACLEESQSGHCIQANQGSCWSARIAVSVINSRRRGLSPGNGGTEPSAGCARGSCGPGVTGCDGSRSGRGAGEERDRDPGGGRRGRFTWESESDGSGAVASLAVCTRVTGFATFLQLRLEHIP